MRRRDSDETDRWPDDLPSESNDPLVVDLRIANPTDGTVATGPWDGVTVAVAGTAHVTSGTGTVERVEVDFGGGFKQATTTAGGWTSWTASELIPSEGSLQITARAIVDGQVITEQTITVTTVLGPKPDVPDPKESVDTTPPVISITSPREGRTLVVTDGQAQIAIAGTAWDAGKGMDRVEVEIDGAPVTVTPVNDSLDNWTAQGMIVGPGRHVVTARALDKVGLRTEASVEIVATDTLSRPPVIERLFLIEQCRLSTFTGRYGRGRVFKTLSLCPGEKTALAYKSYRRTTEAAVESSSILDSNTAESQRDFETSLALEQANKRAFEESSKWNVEAQARASWGWGSASISGGAAGASNASREELAKSITSAVQKHAAKASSKRDVEVKTTREMKREEGEEFSSESTIENINLSRTLNLNFCEVNQEYITVLHVDGFRIGYVRGDAIEEDGKEQVKFTYREATLSQLDSLLRMVIVPERRNEVRTAILQILQNVFDYEDEPHRMVEEKVLVDADGRPVPNGSYLRVPKGKVSKYVDPTTGTEFFVSGVILSVTTNVMKTDGVVCDAVLGLGDALDNYSKGLQREAVESRQLENDRQRATLQKDQLAIKVVKDGDANRAKLFQEVYPVSETEALALVTSPQVRDGSGA